MNDTDLDAALRAHARHWQGEFNPPPLAGMLEVAVASRRSRLRWAGPLIAAVLLLAIPLITVVSLHHRARSAPATGLRPKSTPVGVLSWKDAVLQDDGIITLPARPASDSDFCKYRYHAGAVISQSTATSITITVTQYQDGPAQLDAVTKGLCADGTGSLVGGLTGTIRLGQPLGNRALIDARDGTTHKVLDASIVPKAGYVPPGFTERGVSWSESSTDSFMRTYASARGDFEITREKYDPELDDAGWDLQSQGTGTVLGHPAKYLIWGARPHVSWKVGGYIWTVNQTLYYGASTGWLDQAQLFKIANSLH
jgi:hypothetical protein